MSKIPASAILADFQRMFQERWAYVAGKAETGQVDCSGAFVWSYKQHGCRIYHGSNRIARTEVDALIPIDQATLVPGMIAFKSRSKGLFSGWSLPDDYKPGGDHYNGDLTDYYHVGLVGNDTTQVLNAQSSTTGFVSSNIRKGNWSHVAYLKQVDYGDTSGQNSGQLSVASGQNSEQWPVASGQNGADQNPLTTDHSGLTTEKTTEKTTGIVTAPSGSTVNLRKKPNLHADLVDRVPLGSTVEITGALSGDWYPVRWGKKSGYMMAAFLQISGQ